MALIINSNIPAFQFFDSPAASGPALQRAIRSLSAGLRINSAADPAISERMLARARGLNRAVAGAQNGISMIQVAERALSDTSGILQRMRELSLQAAGDTLTRRDRSCIQAEIDRLRDEITRIGNSTQFNKKKLLNGSAGVLWSTDKMTTKAIIGGGLRIMDQPVRKRPAGGSYKIHITADPGQAEVKKSNIFRLRNSGGQSIGSPFTFSTSAPDAFKSGRGSNLPPGRYDVTVQSVQQGATYREVTASTIPGGRTLPGPGGGPLQTGLHNLQLYALAAAGNTDNSSILFEVTDVDAGTGKVTVQYQGFVMDRSGNRTVIGPQSATFTAGGSKSVFLSGPSGLDMTLQENATAGSDVSEFTVGQKAVIDTISPTAAPNQVKLNITGPSSPFVFFASPVAIDADVIRGRTIDFGYVTLDRQGKATVGTVTLDFGSAAVKDGDRATLIVAPDVRPLARKDSRLRNIDKFWNTQGRFLVEDPQYISITQGNGKVAGFTLYKNDSMEDVAKKISDAIRLSELEGGLGQELYAVNAMQDSFASFVEEEKNTDDSSESATGALLIRSALTGDAGRLFFAGDEDVLNALGLSVLQDAKETNFTVTAADALTGEILVDGVRVSGNRLIGQIHSNVDLEFDAAANVSAVWNGLTKKFDFAPGEKAYTTFLQLTDNSTVIQTGANGGEDMSIGIGDMRSNALGLNRVLITDRESAGRSVTIIDQALDKVSTQRAKLRACQNRLEHTINSLSATSENLFAVSSRIRDTDMAKKMMDVTKFRIMLQFGNIMHSFT